jgi:hypothetical protein
MEHRWGERILVDFPIRVTAHRFSVRDGRLTDLSVSGALLTAELEARALCRIWVAIDLPLWPKHESPVVEAYVARKNKNGIGVEWCEFAPDAVKELLRVVVARPYLRVRRHAASASLTVSRLSSPLLKHST